VLLAATAFTLVSGTVFYRVVEGWSWVDSFYFCTVTLATVGYGDLAPTKDVSKLFTAGYILTGFGVIAAFVTLLVRAPLMYGRETRGRDRGDDDPA
jgi:voltage-gated potassium channel